MVIIPTEVENLLKAYLTDYEAHLRACVERRITGDLNPKDETLKALLKKRTESELVLMKAARECRGKPH